MSEIEFKPPLCFVCDSPSIQLRSPGEMCGTCSEAYDNNDLKTLIERNTHD